MSNKISPEIGDMFRCEDCGFELHVTKGCNCDPGCTVLQCCGKDLAKVTEPEVQNP